jgi:16S rRNA G966 N2-methylase RsmD
VFDAFRTCKLLSEEEPFDIIFIGPPFGIFKKKESSERIEALVAALKQDLLSKDGTLILQAPRWARTSADREKSYGENKLLFYSL